MMSKDKNLSIFLPQMEAIAFIILQILFATRTILKMREFSFLLGNIPSCYLFRPIPRKRKHLMDYNVDYVVVKYQ